MKTNNLSIGERRLLFSMISYTIADLAPVQPFKEDQPPEGNVPAMRLWRLHLSRYKEDALNNATAMAFAVDGDPIVLHSGRQMTFKDCLLELGLENADHIAEQVRLRPEDFGREAGILLKGVKEKVDHPIDMHKLDIEPPEEEPLLVAKAVQAAKAADMGF